MNTRTGLDRCKQLNKQLEMYRAFRDLDGAHAVLRELQICFPKGCPTT